MHIQLLSQDKLEAIHQATLRILSEIGVVLTHPKGRELLVGHGATIKEDRVLFPADLVERCIALCPRQIRLQGREAQKQITLGDGTWHAHNVGGVPNVLELQTMSRRAAVRQDVRDSTRILDALPHITSITPLYTPQDVPGNSMALWMYRDTLPNTTKPVYGPGLHTALEVRYVMEMAQVISSDPQFLPLIGISPISPLLISEPDVEAILEVARQGAPLGPLPCPIIGLTAPMSLAGALAQQNAEVLTTIVLAQLAKPGLPIVYTGRLSTADMRTGLAIWGNPEVGLVSAATAELAHFYNLPVNVYGLCTNAHTFDVENGYERALNALMPALAGADEISGVGDMDGVTACLAQIVIDDEILASVKRLKRGFAVDKDSLAVEVVDHVMKGSRSFLAERHTVKYVRSGEVLITQLAEHGSWDEWVHSGRVGMVERAQAKAEQLLAQHQVPPLSQQQETTLDELVRAAERELGCAE